MKRKNLKRMLALMLATAATLSACGQTPASSTEASTESDTTNVTSESQVVEIKKEDLPVISLYPANANLISGLVSGHKSDYFAENGFQMEVWAYSDEKTNAILTSGDLPDIMYVQKGDTLDTLIETGAILNLEDYLDDMPHLYSSTYMEGALDAVRESYSAGTGELYALPLQIGETVRAASWADSTDRNAVKLRWDVYEEIGAPEIKDYWELIDVMEQMLKAHPQEEDGTKCYGMFLDSGQDTTHLGAMTLWYKWQGYNTDYLRYMLECDMVTGEFSSILSEDSLYYEGLKWYNEVYRRGLMDPESINADRSTQSKKVDAGLAMVPAGTLPGWATKYYEYYIPGTNIYFDPIDEVSTSKYVLAVNANTEHLEECLKVLDMWCDPDAYFRIVMGPEGDVWYSEGNDIYLTDEFKAWLKENGNANNFPMSDGTEYSLWNTSFCVHQGVPTTYGDGKGGYRVALATYWEEAQEITTANENFVNWQKTTGYTNWKELVKDKGVLYESSPVDAYKDKLTNPSDSMKLTMDTLKTTVVNASWNMIYAKDDAEFDAIWNKMLEECEGLGAQDVIDWKLADIEAAKKLVK